jgi:hypothetical protein
LPASLKGEHATGAAVVGAVVSGGCVVGGAVVVGAGVVGGSVLAVVTVVGAWVVAVVGATVVAVVGIVVVDAWLAVVGTDVVATADVLDVVGFSFFLPEPAAIPAMTISNTTTPTAANTMFRRR